MNREKSMTKRKTDLTDKECAAILCAACSYRKDCKTHAPQLYLNRVVMKFGKPIAAYCRARNGWVTKREGTVYWKNSFAPPTVIKRKKEERLVRT